MPTFRMFWGSKKITLIPSNEGYRFKNPDGSVGMVNERLMVIVRGIAYASEAATAYEMNHGM